MMPEPMETKRLVLTPFQVEDMSDAYVGWLNDPAVNRHTSRANLSTTIDDCERYLETMRSAGNPVWAIREVERANQHIGNISAYVDEFNRLAELAILIGDKESWGKGYGLEAWSAVQSCLLGKPDIVKTFAGALINNVGMIRIMEKSGMRREGIMRRHRMSHGENVDVLFFGKLDSD